MGEERERKIYSLVRNRWLNVPSETVFVYFTFYNVSFWYPEPISSIRSPCILLHPLPPSLFGGSFLHHCFNFWRLLLLWHRKKKEEEEEEDLGHPSSLLQMAERRRRKGGKGKSDALTT